MINTKDLCYIIKHNPVKEDNIDHIWESIKSGTGLSDEDLKAQTIGLLDLFSKLYTNKLNNEEALLGQIKSLKREIEVRKKHVTLSESKIQAKKVQEGEKIARKNKVTKAGIKALQDRGMTIKEIADLYGCTRQTIYNRLKEKDNEFYG